MRSMQSPIGLRIAAISYLILGIYALVFPVLYDPALFPLYIIGILSIICGVGVMLLRKWALWISAIIFPIMVAVSSVTVYYSVNELGFYPDWESALFNTSLILYLVLAILALLLVLDKRRELK
jgi:hypothetical protein